MLVAAAAVVGACAALPACNDTVFDPFNNDGKYFSIYGYLDELDTHHEVRVIPITRFPEIIETPADPQAEIDAEVMSDEIEAGSVVASHVWAHRLARLSDGTYGHVFSANFPVTPGRTYRLLVTRGDGIQASAETTVPRVINSDILTRMPVFANADTSVVTQEIVAAQPISSPWGIRAVYVYEGGLINQRRVFVPHGRVGEPTADGGWRLTLDLLADREAIYADAEYLERLGRIEPEQPLFFLGLGVEYRILDADWPLDPTWLDESVVVQPGDYSNVENGYGFFGSVGFYREVWDGTGIAGLLGFL